MSCSLPRSGLLEVYMSYCLNPNCNHQNSQEADICQQCNSALLINNRYRAIKVLGQGGFGKTYLGIDQSHANLPRCVIKQLLPANHNQREKAWQKFQQEAIRLQKLGQHPQIPELLGFVEQENKYYLIQEFIDGQNLAVELSQQGIFNEQKIKKFLEDLLPVIDFIHQNKIIHRDIKPANIVRRYSDGKVILVDFGAAKSVARKDAFQTGTVIGSAEYLAPEQARGKAVFSSDLYGLGVTCIHLLTNVSPFDLIDLNNAWIWTQYLVDNDVSASLIYLLNKMICFSLSQRYQTAADIIRDLHNYSIQSNQSKPKIFQSIVLITLISLGIVSSSIFIATRNKQSIPVLDQKTESSSISTNKTKINPSTKPLEKESYPDEFNLAKDPLEKEALEGLILLQTIENDYYLNNGKFLIKSIYLPFAKGHIFTVS